MKILKQIALAFTLIGAIACGSDKSSSNQETTAERSVDSTATPSAMEERSLPQCTIAGTILEGNQFWVRDADVLVAIVADSSTYSEELQAEGHHILEVYDTKNCQRIDRQVLPIDKSADFPYFIAEITYNNLTQIVAIRGNSTVYCYDVAARKLLPRMTPKFRSQRFGVDAQSGQIVRLEVWENYLMGYAQDYGTFAFDLKDKQKPQAILPFAEYEISESNYAPLFLVTAQNGGVQAIMPEYNRETQEFAIHPAFEQPMNLKTDVQRSATNNRYLVLREQDSNNAVAFDLEKHERVELPADMVSKSTQQILTWMRSNVQ
ncbi:MAG: hypothetical protein SFU99_12260 [Saprospiraceae bacterium]|nr:hypothetical protein [Saprospiraceae bacterium]